MQMWGEKREREEEKKNGVGACLYSPQPKEEGSTGIKGGVPYIQIGASTSGRSCYFGYIGRYLGTTVLLYKV